MEISACHTVCIENLDFVLENVPGDGNCFFHCLSVALFGDYSRTKEIRSIVCQTIYNNWQEWYQKVHLFHGPEMSRYQYWGTMIKLNGWATSCEIEAAALIFSCQINVWLKCSGGYTLTTFGQQGVNFSKINVQLQNDHFQLLHETVTNIDSNSNPTDLSDVTAPLLTAYITDGNINASKNISVDSLDKTTPDKLHSHFNDHCYTSSQFYSQNAPYCKTQNNLHDNLNNSDGKKRRSLGKNLFYSPKSKKIRRKQDFQKTNGNHKHSNMKTDKTIHQIHNNKEQSLLSLCNIFKVQYDTPTDKETKTDRKKRRDRIYHRLKRAQDKSLISDVNSDQEIELASVCQKYGARYQPPAEYETVLDKKNRHRKINKGIKSKKDNLNNPKCLINQTVTQNTVIADTSVSSPSIKKNEVPLNEKEQQLRTLCRKLGITYEFASEGETGDEYAKRIRRVNYRIKTVQQKLQNSEINTPDAPHTFGDDILDKALDHIRAFEIKQMTYELSECSVSNERRIEMHMATAANITVCRRCFSEKQSVKMFSAENNMDPKPLPAELQDLSIVEQQLICRIAPCINIHMLKHGGISSNGHCVTFPQEINEPAKIFPRLPNEVKIIKVCKKGKNNTSKDFKVRRFYVQKALIWLKQNNPVYSDIQISQERLNKLPLDAECDGVPSVEFQEDTVHNNDLGPAPEQIDTGECEGNTNSSVLLPDAPLSIQTEINNVVQDVLGNDAEVSSNRQGTCTIPWPTRDNIPVSEYTTANFFTMAFPALFPYGYADLFANRPRTCSSMSDWADHLLWYKDGRFAHHQYFKFVVHNMIMRKRAAENAKFIVNQKLGDSHLTVADLKEQLKSGNQSIGKKIFYFGASLRGTTQYWAQRGRELRALIQYKINQGDGLPSYFCTASCAEFHFKPLHRLLSMYIEATTGKPVDLSDRNQLFQALQHNTHIVAKYFDLRTQSYFKEVMSPVFNVNAYWYRQEFAKSRGMVHWHGLCWRSDKQPHQLLFEAVQNGLSDDNCANRLAQWAEKNIGMTALHPAGKDETGESRKDMWPPPEGNAPPPPEEKNPLLKLLLDVSSSQASLLEDHLLLTNRFNIHRCSDYCLTVLRKSNPQTKSCRMEFPKEIRDTPGIIKDRNKAMRLEMPRDHPMLVQHSKLHTQGWRANGDISLILSKSGTENPSVDDIMATEKYITGYACKGNQPTGAVADLFNDVINCTDDTEGAKSLCSKLLMGTVKRDISAVEASYELSALPLYRSSHTFQSVSLSGSRVLENNGSRVTKSTPLDRYLERAKDDSSSFYQFICKSGKVPVISGSGIQASWPLEDTFCKNMLLLHWPNWRKISELKDETHSWTLQFQYFLETDKCPNFLKAEVDRVKKQNDTSLDEDDENEGVAYLDESGQPEWMDLVRPVVTFDDIQKEIFFNDGGPEYDWSKASYKYPQGLGTSWIESLNESSELGNQDLVFPEVDLTSMNEDQKFAFNIVMQTLFDFVERENADNLFQPLRMVVMGKAGSGKSFLIKCLVKAIRTLFKSNKSVQVVCPTGNSANLIDGVTLHSFLKIPTYNQCGEMKPPDGSIGATLQENCTGLRALIVDERSLVGSTTFGWMEYMCSQGMAAQLDQSVSWGGLPVVVVLGDEVQLPPVLDSPVYKNSSKSPAAIHGVLIWKEFETVVELQNIIRQANDEQVFRNVLMALRDYKLSKEQAAWLQEFQWDRLKSRYGDELSKRMEMSGLFVFPTHDEEWNHNKDQLLKTNEIYPVAKIKSVSKGSHSNTGDSDKAGGLLRVLYICKNAKVMLTCNLNVPFGLFNGATGKVVDILYQSGRRPPDCFPDVVMVHFHSYTGPPFISEDPKVVPIVPVSRRIDCKCHYCCRIQIPLRLGWATTIHRCQGMTIGSGEANRYIVIHPGTRAFESRNPGALYVALSRAKCSGAGGRDPDFAWNSNVRVNEDRLCHEVTTPTSIARNQQIRLLEGFAGNTKKKFHYLLGKQDLIFHIQRLSEE